MFQRAPNKSPVPGVCRAKLAMTDPSDATMVGWRAALLKIAERSGRAERPDIARRAYLVLIRCRGLR